MQPPTTGPAGIQHIEDLVVETRDGVELAGDAYVPSSGARVPVLVSAYPYRKDDIAGAFNEYWRRWLAGQGYATLLVDCRGTGASRGEVAAAAPAQREAHDGYDMVEWAARQPWCSGDVVAWGISYGGAFALATAAQRPPHLRAVACMYGYADSYSDSVMPGGCPVCLGRFAREAFMLALALAPPARRDLGGRWQEVWRERLAEIERHGPVSLAWLEHLECDDYWRGLQTEVERIEVPAYLVSGWRDLYPEAMARVYRRLTGPKRLLAGPWLHVSPELASRERIDWLGDLRSWLTGVLGAGAGEPDRPPSPESAPREVRFHVHGGGWRTDTHWPPHDATEHVLYLGDGSLLDAVGAPRRPISYRTDPTVGWTSGLVDPLGIGVGYPLDQGEDDRRSVCFTSQPWDLATELVGSPVLELHLDCARDEELMISAKLSDVSPDGSSALITRGCARVALEADPPATAGAPLRLRVSLNATAYRLDPGHRLRLSLAGADFPAVWPSSANSDIRFHHGSDAPSRVVMTIRSAGPPDAYRPWPVDPSANLSPWDAGGSPSWTIERDLVGDAVAVTLGGTGELRLPTGATFALAHDARAAVARERPDQAGLVATAEIRIGGPDYAPVTVTAEGRHTRGSMEYRGTVTVDEERVFTGTWERSAAPPPKGRDPVPRLIRSCPDNMTDDH